MSNRTKRFIANLAKRLGTTEKEAALRLRAVVYGNAGGDRLDLAGIEAR